MNRDSNIMIPRCYKVNVRRYEQQGGWKELKDIPGGGYGVSRLWPVGLSNLNHFCLARIIFSTIIEYSFAA